MVVTVDNPKGASYGGVVSGPIFSKTAKRVLEHMNVPPDHPEQLSPQKPVRRVATAAPAPRPVPAKAPAPVKAQTQKPKVASPARTPRRTAQPVRSRRKNAPAVRNDPRRPAVSSSGFPVMKKTWDD